MSTRLLESTHRYGDEPHWHDGSMDELVPKDNCADCGTPKGEHHQLHCSLAYCRVCGGQALQCTWGHLEPGEQPNNPRGCT